jgi:hypothetical protein
VIVYAFDLIPNLAPLPLHRDTGAYRQSVASALCSIVKLLPWGLQNRAEMER